MRSKDFAVAAGGCCCRPVRPVCPDFSGFLGLSGKLVGTSMRSKDLAKASGLENLFKPKAMKLASMAEVQPSLCNCANTCSTQE